MEESSLRADVWSKGSLKNLSMSSYLVHNDLVERLLVRENVVVGEHDHRSAVQNVIVRVLNPNVTRVTA